MASAPPSGTDQSIRTAQREPLRGEQLAILATLALLTAAAWVLTLSQMRGMDDAMPASPPAVGGMPTGGMPMGGMPMGDSAVAESTAPEPGVRLVVYLGMWVSMMAAMMLPAAAPMILMFGTVYRSKRARGGAFVPTWVFVAGYLAVWASVGAYAWGLSELGADLLRNVPALRELGPRLAALAMLAAGVYQLTPIKERCLSHCRSPLAFVLNHWRDGAGGAVRMGVEHGLYCVGCCWLLFLLLVVVGLASLPWMGLITLIIFAEKLLPNGRVVTIGVAALLIGLGLLVLARPDLLALTTA
jgi:predicted metal-binding membrane protein